MWHMRSLKPMSVFEFADGADLFMPNACRVHDNQVSCQCCSPVTLNSHERTRPLLDLQRWQRQPPLRAHVRGQAQDRDQDDRELRLRYRHQPRLQVQQDPVRCGHGSEHRRVLQLLLPGLLARYLTSLAEPEQLNCRYRQRTSER